MTRHPHLQLEIPIYHDLRDCPGVPKLHWSGVESRYYIMVVDLLEATFAQLFNYCGKQFSLKTTLMIGIQMVERIEMLHKKGYLHRGIKPENFMIGVNDYKKRVYIIDFGMAQRLPVRYAMDQSMVGTANFISVNAHLGLQQTRRDDLESLAFVLVYFLKGSLPWSDVKVTKPALQFQRVSVIKRNTPFERLCGDLPEEFRLFFEHVRSLTFSQEPDYTYLKRLFSKCLGRFAYAHDYHYDWEIKKEKVAMEKAAEKKLNREEMTENWNVGKISGLDIDHVGFSPDNKYLAGVARNECIVWDCTNGRRVATIPHEQQPVGVFFPINDKIVTITHYGEVTEFHWQGAEALATKTKSNKVGNHWISAINYNPNTRSCYVSLQASSEATDSQIIAELSAKDGLSLKELGPLPAKSTSQSWSIGDQFYVYFEERSVYLRSLTDRKKSNYKNQAEVAKRSAEAHNFCSITATGNNFCAALGHGRVYIWTNVMPRCNIQSPTNSIHWHQDSPLLAMANSAALYSYAYEGILVRFSSARAKPTFCRNDGLARRIQLSLDGSLLALLKDDNSLQLVQTSSFEVYTTCQGIYQPRKGNKQIWVSDYLHHNNIVSNFQPGWLQWTDAITGIVQKTANISLENVEKGETKSNITYYQIEDAFLASYAACTLEARVNWGSLQKRIRIWDRRSPNLRLQETFRVSDETVTLVGCPSPISHDDKIFIAITSKSEFFIYRSYIDPSGVLVWSQDRSRDSHWQNAQFLGCSTVLAGGYWVSLHTTKLEGDGGCAVLWDLQTMNPLEVIQLSSTPLYVEWATPNRFIFATTKEVSAFDLHSMTLVWTVEEYLPVHCSLQGCYLIDGNNVLDFDPNLCLVKETIEFPMKINRLLLRHIPSLSNSVQCLSARSTDGSFVTAVKRNEMTEILPGWQNTKATMTPFAALSANGEDTVEKEAMAYRPVKEQRMVRPIQLFDAPAHLIPSLSTLAPIFIASCLLPPSNQEIKPKLEEANF
ncbi:unnamed protein product, partial [Mesorhabditis belari]|uniref:Protein kinase domain-containing protein n=1 Tax=Mesorhabditis belari TaxID=2138241 RepID=A0AAF3EFK6_9BILA